MLAKDIEPIVKTMNSPEDTAELASKLAKILEKGDILLFTGEIGTGKRRLSNPWPKISESKNWSPVRPL